ncbi:MAG: STAS domain-containing protein [Melioribacteraceae bacterium]|nr:STAS domain-containing protein [Melioribacteraceae bacterium]MCO6472532.1 STAS domain-containing protein [Melioribacteraceae bacterium]
MYEKFRKEDIVVVDLDTKKATISEAISFKNYLLEIIENESPKIILDCREVVYMDSSFLGALVFALKKSLSAKGEIVILRSEEESPVWTMFSLTKMDKVFKLFTDEQSAIDSFSSET